jgi:cell shape-determining protein MreC
LLTEISNKNRVVQENLDLKRDILKYKELEAINKDLKDQISKLQLQTSIQNPKDKNLTLVNISGIQNIFSSAPTILIRAGSNQNVSKNDVVYYESNTLLGFVSEVYPNSSKVLPFYAPELKANFQVPVQNLKDPSQKSFISPIENGIVKMAKVPEYPISEGDVWITGNEVSEVPPNLIVGITKKVTLAPQEGFQEIELEVPFNVGSTNYVFIENKTK